MSEQKFKSIAAKITDVVDTVDGDCIVKGFLLAEEPDNVNEVWDYESSVPYLQQWSQKFAHLPSGSVGNLRVQHTSKVAGKFITMQPDDAAKKVYVEAKVTDEQEKINVREGAYSGFSIKAGYFKRWKDPANKRLTRWTSNPIVEGSLVDLPAMPSAVFTYKSADGTTTEKHFTVLTPEHDAALQLFRDALSGAVDDILSQAQEGVTKSKSENHSQGDNDMTEDEKKELREKVSKLDADLTVAKKALGIEADPAPDATAVAKKAADDAAKAAADVAEKNRKKTLTAEDIAEQEVAEKAAVKADMNAMKAENTALKSQVNALEKGFMDLTNLVLKFGEVIVPTNAAKNAASTTSVTKAADNQDDVAKKAAEDAEKAKKDPTEAIKAAQRNPRLMMGGSRTLPQAQAQK